mmetsp:Transcript_18909/g.39399  ORF Transcript_18909/g.39399 Transcript_18909/m.39399 type:complete len:236 (+) Transcript_18909:247-954(+)
MALLKARRVSRRRILWGRHSAVEEVAGATLRIATTMEEVHLFPLLPPWRERPNRRPAEAAPPTTATLLRAIPPAKARAKTWNEKIATAYKNVLPTATSPSGTTATPVVKAVKAVRACYPKNPLRPAPQKMPPCSNWRIWWCPSVPIWRRQIVPRRSWRSDSNAPILLLLTTMPPSPIPIPKRMPRPRQEKYSNSDKKTPHFKRPSNPSYPNNPPTNNAYDPSPKRKPPPTISFRD